MESSAIRNLENLEKILWAFVWKWLLENKNGWRKL